MLMSELAVGRTVFDVQRRKVGTDTVRVNTTVVLAVVVVQIDPDGFFVVAEKDGGPAKRYTARQVAKWKLNKPVLVPSGWGHRLATRFELQARKNA